MTADEKYDELLKEELAEPASGEPVRNIEADELRKKACAEMLFTGAMLMHMAGLSQGIEYQAQEHIDALEGVRDIDPEMFGENGTFTKMLGALRIIQEAKGQWLNTEAFQGAASFLTRCAQVPALQSELLHCTKRIAELVYEGAVRAMAAQALLSGSGRIISMKDLADLMGPEGRDD